jgi:hypothetical protein
VGFRPSKSGILSVKRLEKNVEKPWFYENRLQMVDVPHASFI